ncbi:hypothetical protein QFY99_09080 [Sphingobacterium faecium]|nr:hypothetical protein [Sphingobacterium faecium]
MGKGCWGDVPAMCGRWVGAEAGTYLVSICSLFDHYEVLDFSVIGLARSIIHTRNYLFIESYWTVIGQFVMGYRTDTGQLYSAS